MKPMGSELLLPSLLVSLLGFVAPSKEAKPGLLARAHGELVSEEFEEEHALLVSSFDIRVPKHGGIEEVQVNAMTGAMVPVVHEDAAAESNEAKAEGKKRP